jgi:alpha-tubulin suppressor-like RCC1 family protein
MQPFEGHKVTSLALGARHSCAVLDQRAVSCWGDGRAGQLRLGPPMEQSLSPVPVGTEGEDVRVGGAHTCVRAGQHLRCFGSDAEGQLGQAPEDAWARGAAVRDFALGEAHTCVAFSDQVTCRGRPVAAPAAPLLGSMVVTALTAGGDHTCALLADRTVRCWGKNDAGQLGDGTTNDAQVPVEVAGLRDVVEIAAGARHTCARLASHNVVCWGDGSHHQLANGLTEKSTRPVGVQALLGVEQIACAGDSACARMADGTTRCWGANERGQLGDGSTVEHDVPMPPTLRLR